MITPDDRQRLYEALLKLCHENGADEVQEALADVVEAIEQETGEFDLDVILTEELDPAKKLPFPTDEQALQFPALNDHLEKQFKADTGDGPKAD